MGININFQPKQLTAMVKRLEKIIGKPTGSPIRLDFEVGLRALLKYRESGKERDFPSSLNVSRISLVIKKAIDQNLLECYLSCLERGTSAQIQHNLVRYYFDHYNDRILGDYLRKTIDLKIIKSAPWRDWVKSRDSLFSDDPIEKMIVKAGIAGVEIPDLGKYWGLNMPFRLREDAYATLAKNKIVLESYIKRLSPESIENIQKNADLESFHIPIWDITLPLFLEQAKELKIDRDQDHRLFALARIILKPPRGIKWQRLSQKAKLAYKDWSIGTQLESVFYTDSNNKRINYWKQKIVHIDEVLEIEYRGETAALAITIGRYQFVEFKDIGAIYVYNLNTVDIPNRVTDLSHLKFKKKVIKPGFGTENGEGWIAHQGKMWPHFANKLIDEALKQW